MYWVYNFGSDMYKNNQALEEIGGWKQKYVQR